MSPWLGAWIAVVGALTVHAWVNTRLLRQPGRDSSFMEGKVSVLVPVRDEAHRIRPCLESLLAQEGVDVELIVLDDCSSDSTVDIVRELGIRVIAGAPLPAGWLGKPFACHQLATASHEPILVFVDADVVLHPTAVAQAVRLLEGVDLVSPYPRIITTGVGERLVQPLLQWSWLTFLPLRAMERSRRPSLAAAGGQFLAVRRSAYERAGGHAAVRDRVLDDIELARGIKRAGGRIALADGSTLARCHMYGSWAALREGYTKSLWASFGSGPGAAAVVAVLLVLYVLPVPVMLLGEGAWVAAAIVVYALGVLGRVVSARASAGRVVDALAHPVSIAVFAWLVARSFARRGRTTWKGRPV